MSRNLKEILKAYNKATPQSKLALTPKEAEIFHKHNQQLIAEQVYRGAAIQIGSDYEPYQCPVTGRAIEGKAAHRENLKRTGSRLLEPGESRDYAKNKRAADDAAIEKSVSETVDKIAGELDI